jgi:hypothetical protein
LDLLTLYTHHSDYRQYSAIAGLNNFQLHTALGFSIFTSCILATDLQQSHCHFKSHIKPSFHSPIRFSPVFCNCQLSSIPLLPSSYPGRLASRNSIRLNSMLLLSDIYAYVRMYVIDVYVMPFLQIFCSFIYTVCSRSPFGVLMNCGAQTN